MPHHLPPGQLQVTAKGGVKAGHSGLWTQQQVLRALTTVVPGRSLQDSNLRLSLPRPTAQATDDHLAGVSLSAAPLGREAGEAVAVEGGQLGVRDCPARERHRDTPGGGQEFLRRWSGVPQKVVRSSSGGGQEFLRRRSGVPQEVVRRRSLIMC